MLLSNDEGQMATARITDAVSGEVKLLSSGDNKDALKYAV